MLHELEGKSFKDLSKKEQNVIRRYSVRCAVIPGSWPMADYIEFFKRIQGGGTPMTDHELRRAISRGPFTELLDELAEDPSARRALGGATKGTDDLQQLLLRYHTLHRHGIHKSGKPHMSQQGLETMK